MKEKRAYFVGATIVSHQALNRVQTYEKNLHRSSEQAKEKHLTVLPPFMATYEEASDINLSCALSSILSTHPINTTVFAMQGLDIMEFGGLQFLHFPIEAFATKEPWADFVLRIRERLQELKLEFRYPIPDEYRSHITVFEGKNLQDDRGIQALIRQSHKEPALHFHALYLSLYAKYNHGWDVLSFDPTQEQQGAA
jgi:hypothetical protein